MFYGLLIKYSILFQKHITKKTLTTSAKKRYKSIILNKNGKRTINEINNASLILNSNIFVSVIILICSNVIQNEYKFIYYPFQAIKCSICNKSTEIYCKRNKVQKPQKSMNNKTNQNTPDMKIKQNESKTQNLLIKKSLSNNQNTPNKIVTQNSTNKNVPKSKNHIRDNKNAHLFYRTADETTVNTSPQPPINENAINKKKKKKDKFAGLFADACIASQNIVKKDNPLNILLRQT